MADAASTEARLAALEAQVRMLHDRQAVRDLVLEYGRTIDDKDWATHRAMYADPLDIDYSSMPGGPRAERIALDDWIERVRSFFDTIPQTQHITEVLKLEIDGDRAHVVAMLHAQHYMPTASGEPIQRQIGTYDKWFARTADGWRITGVKPNLRWNEGNYWIFLKAAGAPLPPE